MRLAALFLPGGLGGLARMRGGGLPARMRFERVQAAGGLAVSDIPTPQSRDCSQTSLAPLPTRVPSILRSGTLRAARPRPRLPPPRGLRSTPLDADSDGAAAPCPHASVLLEETVRAFEGLRVRTLLDCTLGAGGHAAALAAAHPELQRIVGIDLDPTALELAGARLRGLGFQPVRVPGPGEAGGAGGRAGKDASTRVAGAPCGTCYTSERPYSELLSVLEACSIPPGSVDAILLDAGMSSMQVDSPSRGFSFRHPAAALDMRMGPGAGPLDAAQLLARSSQARLEEIFRLYGQIPRARALAERVVWTRATAPIETVGDFLRAVGGRRERGRSHPATRAFQALRIAVNDELRRLEEALRAALFALRPGGRLAIISFHSLEDGIVKRAFRAAAGTGCGADAASATGPREGAVGRVPALEHARGRCSHLFVRLDAISAGMEESQEYAAKKSSIQQGLVSPNAKTILPDFDDHLSSRTPPEHSLNVSTRETSTACEPGTPSPRAPRRSASSEEVWLGSFNVAISTVCKAFHVTLMERMPLARVSSMSLTGAALLLARLCAKDDAMRQVLQSSYADLCVFAVAAVSVASKLMGTRTCTPTCMLSALVAGLPHRALYDAELAICVGLEWDMAAILRSAELLG